MFPSLIDFSFFFFQTENCGWGVKAAESINKGDFVIEYVGEGISLSYYRFSFV